MNAAIFKPATPMTEAVRNALAHEKVQRAMSALYDACQLVGPPYPNRFGRELIRMGHAVRGIHETMLMIDDQQAAKSDTADSPPEVNAIDQG